jgi:hypothetical protein
MTSSTSTISHRPLLAWALIAGTCGALAATALLQPQPAAAQAAKAAPSAPALPTLKDILARSLEARGGRAKLRAVETRRETGRLSLAEGAEWPFTLEHKRPRSLRMELDLQGTKLIRVYDGVHGWQQQPQKKVAEEMGLDDRRNIANEADFDFCGALIETNTKGSAELVGKQTAEGRDVYRLKVVLLTGDVSYYDLDATTYLPIHWEGARWINGRLATFESSFSDYRDVDGIKYPFLILTWMNKSTQKQKRTFVKIENNPPIDDARFAMPADAIPAPSTPPARPAGSAPAAATPAPTPPAAAATPAPIPPPTQAPPRAPAASPPPSTTPPPPTGAPPTPPPAGAAP